MKKATNIIILIVLFLLVVRFKTFLLVQIFGLSNGMEPNYNNEIELINKTGETTYYCYSFTNDLPVNTPSIEWGQHNKNDSISLKEFQIIADSIAFIKNVSNKSIVEYSQDKTLRIFTFDGKVINTKSWKEIRNKKLWKKKYLITLDELELLKWNVELK